MSKRERRQTAGERRQGREAARPTPVPATVPEVPLQGSGDGMVWGRGVAVDPTA